MLSRSDSNKNSKDTREIADLETTVEEVLEEAVQEAEDLEVEEVAAEVSIVMAGIKEIGMEDITTEVEIDIIMMVATETDSTATTSQEIRSKMITLKRVLNLRCLRPNIHLIRTQT